MPLMGMGAGSKSSKSKGVKDTVRSRDIGAMFASGTHQTPAEPSAAAAEGDDSTPATETRSLKRKASSTPAGKHRFPWYYTSHQATFDSFRTRVSFAQYIHHLP